MTPPMKEYVPVPVTAAKHIAESFAKSIVIIAAWDPEHELLHTTTYGVAPADKVNAAHGGETVAKALSMDLARQHMYEDFREDFDAARARAMQEAIEKYLPDLKAMAAQVIGKPDNYFARMVQDLERTMT